MNFEIYQKRAEKLIERMEENSCLILFAPPPRLRNQDVYYPYRASSDLLYLTGVSQENIVLLLFSNGERHIFAPAYDPKKERWEGKYLTPEEFAERLHFSKKDGVHEYKRFWEKLPKLLKKKSAPAAELLVKTLYWDFGNRPEDNQRILALLDRLMRSSRSGTSGTIGLKHTSSLLDEMRLFKDEFEIKIMKEAAHISTQAHENLMRYARTLAKTQDEIYEYDLRSFLEANFMKKGAEALAYPSIVAGGENATVLHYIECRSLVKKTDLLLVDAGCELLGYASDITRTYPVSGKFSEAQKDIYAIVLEAQKAAISECKPGSDLGKVHKKAVEVLVEGLWELGLLKKCIQEEKNGKFHFTKPSSIDEVIEKEYYFPFYMHNTSHYLGLDVHDVGSYYEGKKHRPLRPGMVFTVEPGLYFPCIYEHIPEKYRGIGIRIEDDILITDEGAEVLTDEAPKEIHEIEGLEIL